MELVRKLHGLLSNPKRKLWWAAVNSGRIPLLIRRGRPGALLSYFVTGATGWRVYDYYVDHVIRRSGETIEREVRGYRMELDLRDEGLSRDLFIYGIREERGTELFERELSRVADTIDDGVVLDIGANIGYFALMELDALGDSASLVAFEPDEGNATLLERNLERNGFRDATTIERAAVGPECGSAEFELSSHSNLNKVRAESTVDPDYDTGRTITVDMWSIDEYLEVHEIDPDSVVAARMDVEGYEVEVIRGMERLLGAAGPLVLSLEIHPGRLETSEVRDLGERLDEYGFEVVEALTETITAYPLVATTFEGVESPRDIPENGPAYNVVFVKNRSTEGTTSKSVDVSTSSTDPVAPTK